jgi:hypothetical protein
MAEPKETRTSFGKPFWALPIGISILRPYRLSRHPQMKHKLSSEIKVFAARNNGEIKAGLMG